MPVSEYMDIFGTVGMVRSGCFDDYFLFSVAGGASRFDGFAVGSLVVLLSSRVCALPKVFI